MILLTIFGHDPFWGPFWDPFSDQIGQREGKMSPREPSGASKSQKAACSKTLKNLEFLHVFGSRGIPRKPQDQNVQKKTVKKTVKKKRTYKKKWKKKHAVVKNALRWRSHSGPRMEPLFGDISCSFLSSSFT